MLSKCIFYFCWSTSLAVFFQPLSRNSAHVLNAVGKQPSLGLCRFAAFCSHIIFLNLSPTREYVLKGNFMLSGDNYVHRLIQNKGDGKLVEVDEGGNIMQTEKVDSIQLEVTLKINHMDPFWSISLFCLYDFGFVGKQNLKMTYFSTLFQYTYLLTSQLESQRHYFEERMASIEQEALKRVSHGFVDKKTISVIFVILWRQMFWQLLISGRRNRKEVQTRTWEMWETRTAIGDGL